ncbi:MAG: DMT family transporter [bacterium]|nr:DMT family transporter [bacterium]
MGWLYLSLLSAITLAICDSLSKYYLTGYSAHQSMLVRLGWTVIFLLPIYLLYPLPEVPLEFWGWIAAMVPLELGATYLFLQAIQEFPLAKTLPYMALTPVFVLLTGTVFLGEVLSPADTAGVFLVAFGTYLLNINDIRNLRWRTLMQPFVDVGRHRGARLMIIVAFVYSITAAGTKKLLQFVPPKEMGIFYFFFIGVVAVILSVFRRPSSLKILWRKPLPHFLIGASFGLMVIFHFFAIEHAPVAVMIAVKRTSILFGIILGAVFFGERRLLQSLLAASVMIAGVALIVLA